MFWLCMEKAELLKLHLTFQSSVFHLRQFRCLEIKLALTGVMLRLTAFRQTVSGTGLGIRRHVA